MQYIEYGTPYSHREPSRVYISYRCILRSDNRISQGNIMSTLGRFWNLSSVYKPFTRHRDRTIPTGEPLRVYISQLCILRSGIPISRK